MIDPVTLRRWMHWVLLVAIAAVLVFLRLLPVDFGAGRWPGPDLLLAVAMVWVMRRPDYAPAPLLAVLFLLSDMLFMRPPGLWAAICLTATEFLRSRSTLSRDIPFGVEMLMVTGVLSLMTIAKRLVLAIFVVPQTGFTGDVKLMISTLLAYPLVVAFSAVFLRLRKAAPGEVDELGHPI